MVDDDDFTRRTQYKLYSDRSLFFTKCLFRLRFEYVTFTVFLFIGNDAKHVTNTN